MAAAVDAAARPNDPPWLKGMLSDLGLAEIPGARHNARILEMMRAIGRPDVQDDETAWCAGSGAYYLVAAGVPLSALPPKEDRLLARAYLRFGRRLDEPVRGCIVIFRRGASSWQGHFAFFLRFVTIDGTRYVECVGGNQRNAITIASYEADTVLGFRWPGGFPVPGSHSPPAFPAPPRPMDGLRDTAAGITLAGAGGAVGLGMGAPGWVVLAGVAAALLAVAALILHRHLRG